MSLVEQTLQDRVTLGHKNEVQRYYQDRATMQASSKKWRLLHSAQQTENEYAQNNQTQKTNVSAD